MKKLFLMFSVVAATLAFGSCSSDEPTPGTSGETMTSYLSVNLVSSDPTASRADAGYENGTPAENKVDRVRFYFFTGTGAAANVKLNGGNYVNYYDWFPENGDQTAGTEGSNVGSKLSAHLVIETPKGDKLPTQIAAVINPTEEAQSRTLSQLKAIQKDYAASGLTAEGKFVMFNSVYGNSAGSAEICTVSIKDENLAKTPELAKTTPVVIYVERCVAKVSVDMAAGFDSETKLLKLTNKNGEDLTVGGEQVYLKINGWKLAAETDNGNLVKNIDVNWSKSDGIGSWWNNYNNKRSCWAINAPEAANRYWTYTDITDNGSKSALYTNENADNFGDNKLNNTKVILGGTLCHANGDAFTIVRHIGSYFPDTYSETESSNLPELKKNILSQLAVATKYYWKDGETFKSIAPADLQIVTEELDEIENATAHDCFVYAQLTDEAKARTWYASAAEDAIPIENGSTVINTALEKNVDKALVWKSGMTYYYYEIIHHTDVNDNKTIGVVRNHVYKTTVTKIAGFGTPVYNPDQKIYPEKPDPNDHYVAAQINILAWHIVTDNYELEW